MTIKKNKKFIMDTSCFGSVEVKNFQENKLSDLILKSCHSIFLTPVLIEERLDFFDQPLDCWTPAGIECAKYIFSLPFEKMFRDMHGSDGILYLDLTERLIAKSLYVDVKEFRNIVFELKEILKHEDLPDLKYKNDKAQWRKIKKNRRVQLS